MINHIIQLFEEHEFITAVSLVTAFYLAPIFAKAFFAIIGGIIAFIVKMLFNDALEKKIRSIIGNLLGSLLNNNNIQVKDIPLLDSDYLCIFQLHIPVTNNLTVDIPTVRIRVRFWRLLRKTFWLYLTHLDNRLAFNGYFKLLCSEELKEINLQNANILWKCNEHIKAEDCYREASFDFTQLNIFEEKLKLYTFHLLWERADLKLKLPGEDITVENLGGHINNECGKYEIYLHGLLDGQIISIANTNNGIRNFRLMIPAINLTPFPWAIICDNIPALAIFHAVNDKSMGRMLNVICYMQLKNSLEVTELEWTFRNGHGEYIETKSQHTYSLTAIEGNFYIKDMREFTATKLNLKINNHNIGLAGTLSLLNPITDKKDFTNGKGSFSLALDSNNFSFLNGLEFSVLDRFILEGEINFSSNSIGICFHSDKENSINAFKFVYQDLSIIVDHFFGNLTVEDATCFSQDIGFYLVSASRFGSKGIYGRKLIHLQSLYYDFTDQNFALQLRANNFDAISFNKGLKPKADINSFIDIHGDFSANGNINTFVNTY